MTAPLPPGGITAAVLGPLLAGDPHRPRLIWHGAGRTELSTASLANWSAKTAGLLVDELGGRPGGTVVWRVRRSWQGVPLLLGAWWAGMVVTDCTTRPPSRAPSRRSSTSGDESGADEVIVASVAPVRAGHRPDRRSTRGTSPTRCCRRPTGSRRAGRPRRRFRTAAAHRPTASVTGRASRCDRAPPGLVS